MKLSKRTRLIGLSAALVLLIAIGIGGGVWYFNRAGEEAPGPEFSGVERAGMIKEGEIYQEEKIREFPHPWAYGNILSYSKGGAILMADESGAWMEDMITGEVIQKIPENWKAEGWLWEAAFDDEDSLYGAIEAPEGIKIFCLDPNGKTEEKLRVNFLGEKIRKFLVDEDGCYFLDENSNLEAFLWDGQRCLQLDHVRDIAVDGQGTLYVNRFEPLEAYQMPQAEKIYSSNNTLSYGMQIEGQMAYEKNLGLLYINGDSFTQIFNAENGSFLGTAMQNGDSAPSMDNCAPGLYVDGEQNIYCTIRNELTFDFMDDRNAVEARHPGLKLGVYRYQIVENRRDEMPYTLTVTGPYRSDYMARVIQQFELEHPDQRVKYEYEYVSQQDFYRRVDQDGYFDRMNLRILSGDVGDLVMTGGTWSDVYHFFSNTDLFEDLTPLLEKSQFYRELDPVLLKGIEIDGKMKGVPLEIDYYYAMIDSELCQKSGVEMDWDTASWGDVLDLLSQLEGTDCYLFEAMGDMQRAFTRMLISNMPDLIDRRTKEVNLRQDWFIELIEKWRKAESHPNFFKQNFERGLAGKGLISIDGMTSRNMETDELYLIRQLKEKTGHIAEVHPLFCGEKSPGRTATGADMYSIYSASENKEAAQQLLEIAIRQDMQQTRVLSSGPLNQAAREKRIQRAIYWSGSPNQEVEMFYQQFERIYTSVDTLYDMNKLKEDLWRPLWDYIEGQKTLDQALEQAEQNLRLRLYE